jgi:hypothetical protein
MTADVGVQVDVAPEQPGDGTGYRYPGAPPFQDTVLDRELFRGREREADTVLQSILSSNLLVLYSVSGLGKSSLLNAGVMYRLRERRHWPVSVRVNDPTTPVVELIRKQIEAAALADPTVELLRDPTAGPASADPRLWDVLALLEIWRRNDMQQLVIVLDQFEELFTLGWADTERHRFIAEFGEVLRGFRLEGPGDDASATNAMPPPRVKFVIVIREDSLGELEALSRDVPQIMHNRFRLEPLRLDQAEAAIREPAMMDDARLGSSRFAYSQAASDLILDFLRTRTVRGTVVHADAVDPSQLQIVCQFVERSILPNKQPSDADGPIEIDDVDLGGRDGLEGVLRHFYQRTLQTFPAARQRAVRNLCENGLINKSRRRLSLDEEEIERTFAVTPDDLKQLVDERLLRADPRLDSVYYELAHDTLIDPILDHREELKAQHARRRRQWIVAGAVAAGLAALVVGVVVFILRWSDDGEHFQPLVLGVPVDGVVEGGTGDTPFKLTDVGNGETVVTVTPGAGAGEPIDVAIEVTSAAGVTRLEDRVGPGEAELVVVPREPTSAAVAVRVTSLNSASGPFTIAADRVAAGDLRAGQPTIGRVVDPDGIAVYRVDVDSATPMVVDVIPSGPDGVYTPSGLPLLPPTFAPPTPSGGGGGDGDVGDVEASGKEAKAPTELDIEVEVISGDGSARRVDSAAAGDGERFSVTAAGPSVVVIRGYQASVGAFVVDAAPTTPLVVGQRHHVQLAPSGRPTSLVFDAASGGPYLARVLPAPGVDVSLEVLRPDAVVVPADNMGAGRDEATIVAGPEGQYVLSVSAFQPIDAGVDVEVVAVRPTRLTADTWRAVATGDVVDLVVERTPLTVVARPAPGVDPVLQVLDPHGATRLVDGPAPDAIEAVMLTTPGTHTIRVSDFIGGPGGLDVIAMPATRAVPIRAGQTVEATAPVVFDVVVAGGDPLTLTAEPTSDEAVLDTQVLDPDGFPIGNSGTVTAPGAQAAATIVATRPGTYHVVVTSSDAPERVTAALAPVHRVTTGDEVSGPSPTTFLVDVGPDELMTVGAQAPGGIVGVEVTSPQGTSTAVDPVAGFTSDGSATAVLGMSGAGAYAVRVTSTVAGGDVTASVLDAPARQLTSTVTTTGPAAVFDVDVGSDELLWFTAVAASPAAGLDVHVINPRGEDLGAAAVPARRSVPAELPASVRDLFPPAVVALFADGLPATVEEVAAELVAAGLLDEALAVVEAHPEVDAIAFGPPPLGDVEAVVGSSGAGTYRIVVSAADQAAEITSTRAPIPVQSLEPGASTTVVAPAAIDVEVGDRPLVVTASPASADVELATTAFDARFSPSGGADAPSNGPGQPATSIVGGSGGGTYRVLVMSSQEGSAAVVTLR